MSGSGWSGAPLGHGRCGSLRCPPQHPHPAVQRRPAALAQGHVDEGDAAAGAHHLADDDHRVGADRTQEVQAQPQGVGGPADHVRGKPLRLPDHQRRRRAAVLGPWRPGTDRRLGGLPGAGSPVGTKKLSLTRAR